jgi:hypothetical protein
MNQKIINVLVFTAGAAIGSLVTWKVVKDRYERILQEEIDSVKETWERLAHEESDDDCDDEDELDEDNEDGEEEDEGFDSSTMTDYASLASKYGHTSGKSAENDGKGEGDDEVPYINGPYVIPPEEYGNGNFDHGLYCLTYYSDDVLANDWWETLDIEETIGRDALEHFGDYTDDIVHVRNERLNGDYEVVRDYRTYAEVTANDPLMRAYAD